jgi:hypothetical protein
MGRLLSALAALLILAAAGSGAAAKTPFSIATRGLTFTDKVASVTVLPGTDLDLVIAGDDGPYRLESRTGTVSVRRAGAWRWRAPSLPGLVTLTVDDGRGRKVHELNVFVLVPIGEVRDGRLNGYRIGTYPEKTRPVGFVEVTAETMLAKLSPHFALRQFLCKQAGGFPKYVVISEPLILKLERIVEALDRAGHQVDTLTIMSGYRTPFYNENIGNVRDSQHTGSTAAHGPFVHVDVRGRLARWRG